MHRLIFPHRLPSKGTSRSTVEINSCFLCYTYLQGLQIAHYLLTSYPQRCQLWRFDSASYQTALHDRSAALEANELAGLAHLPAVFASLVATMQQERRKAYQEGITHLLLEDIEAVLRERADTR